MKINGIVTRIDANGYERLLTIEVDGKTVWCSCFEPSEYLEPGEPSVFLKIGTVVRFKVILTLVLKSGFIGDKICRGMTQNIHNSPHVVAFGRVEERLASDAYLVSVGEADSIEVQFEQDVGFNVGDYIWAEGELAAEDDIDE